MMQMRIAGYEQECLSLEDKIAQLKAVASQRAKVNRNNTQKLKSQEKTIESLRSSRRGADRHEECRGAEFELGELNQQLLLVNEDIAKHNYKLTKKKQLIEDMHTRLHAHRQLDQGLPSMIDKKVM